MKSLLALIGGALILLTTISWVEAQNAPAASPPSKLEKITNDLYVIRGEGGNTTVYLTDEGVVLVDVKFDRNYEDIQTKVRSLTDKPVRYIFNTHSHGDHTGGNPKFLPAAQIIAHQNARSAMIQGKQPGPPQLTYTDEISINLGGKEVIAHYFGRAHTDGDTWVYFPAAKVLASGDAFNTGNGAGQTGSTTFGFYIAPGGSVVDISNTVDGVLKKWDFDAVVPGHGPVGKRADLVKWRDEIGKLRSRISAMVREGKNKDDVTKMLIDEFGWDPKGRGTLNSVDGMMAELKASNSDSAAANADPRDFSGVWSPAGSKIPTNDITDHLLPGEEISFTPYGAERYKTIDHAKDATNRCGPAGYMRGMQTPLMPFQIVQSPTIISVNMEYMYSFRLIYIGGKHPSDVMDYPEWMGHSVAHWEGNTLVVDAIAFKDKTWLDTNGLEHSDKLHLVERFEKTDPNTLRWTVTVDDPVFFTHPFRYAFDFKRQDTRVLSYDCGENEKDAAYMKPTLGGAHNNKKVLRFPN